MITSAALISLGVHPPVTTPTDFLQRVVLSPQPGLFEIWLLVGAVMAAPFCFQRDCHSLADGSPGRRAARRAHQLRAVLATRGHGPVGWGGHGADPARPGNPDVWIDFGDAGAGSCQLDAYRDLVVREKV